MNPGRHPCTPRAGIAALAAVCALGLSASAGIIPRSLCPVPRLDDPRGWYQRQHARYVNAPLVQKAERLLARKEYAAAEPLLAQAAANAPYDLELLLEQTETCRRLEQWDKALALCDQALELAPDYPALMLYRAGMALDAGRYDEAASSYQRALALLPPGAEPPPALARRFAEARHRAGRPGAAGQGAEESMQDATEAETQRALADEAIRKEDWPAAIEHTRQALALTRDAPARGRYLLKLGYLHTRTGDLTEARDDFTQAADLLAGRAQQLEIRRQLGQNAYRRGDYAEATRHFKIYLLQEYDENIAAAYLSALVLLERDELAVLEARAFLKREDTSDAFREAARRTLMSLYKKLERNDEYYRAAQQLYRAFPKREYLLETAVAAERLGQAEEAVRLYQAYTEAGGGVEAPP